MTDSQERRLTQLARSLEVRADNLERFVSRLGPPNALAKAVAQARELRETAQRILTILERPED